MKVTLEFDDTIWEEKQRIKRCFNADNAYHALYDFNEYLHDMINEEETVMSDQEYDRLGKILIEYHNFMEKHNVLLNDAID